MAAASGAAAAAAASAAAADARRQQGRRRLDDRRHRARHHDVDPRPGAVLRRPGPQQEHAVGADAGVRHLLDDRRAVVHLRLQPGVHRGQRLHRRLRPALPEGHVRSGRRAPSRWRATFSKGVVHPRAAVRRLPGDLRGHHLLPDRRRLRRAHEVLRRAAVHGAVVHLQLRADRAHGLVLDGPGRLQRQGSRRRDERQGRLASGRWARSTSPAAPWCTSTPRSPAWSAPT